MALSSAGSVIASASNDQTVKMDQPTQENSRQNFGRNKGKTSITMAILCTLVLFFLFCCVTFGTYGQEIVIVQFKLFREFSRIRLHVPNFVIQKSIQHGKRTNTKIHVPKLKYFHMFCCPMVVWGHSIWRTLCNWSNFSTFNTFKCFKQKFLKCANKNIGGLPSVWCCWFQKTNFFF